MLGGVEKLRPRYVKEATFSKLTLRRVMDGFGWVLNRSMDRILVFFWLMSRCQACVILSRLVTSWLRPVGVEQTMAMSSA